MIGRRHERRAVRSDKYQYILVEVLMSADAWNMFHEYQEKALPLSDEKREILLNWDRELKHELHVMIDQCLTDRQKAVLTMYADGYTQMEIAEHFGINQSSVTKTLNGNADYSKGKKIYGGLRNKFIKLIKRNFEIRPIMKKIHLIWEPNSIRLAHYQTFRNLLGTEEEFEKWLDETPEEFNTKVQLDEARGTKLSKKQILELKEKHSQGYSQKSLCARFHISPARMQRYLESV